MPTRVCTLQRSRGMNVTDSIIKSSSVCLAITGDRRGIERWATASSRNCVSGHCVLEMGYQSKYHNHARDPTQLKLTTAACASRIRRIKRDTLRVNNSPELDSPTYSRNIKASSVERELNLPNHYTLYLSHCL